MSYWREKNNTLMEKINHTLQNFMYTDVTLSVSNGMGKKEFKVHKYILSLSSEIFETALNGDLKEASSKLIEIEGIDHDIFQLFIDFLYTDKAQLTSVKECIELYKVAHKYMTSSLITFCIKYIKSNYNLASVCTVIEFAQLYMIEDLKSECLLMVEKEIKTIISTADFLSADLETVATILSLNNLKILEFDLFKGVEKWINNMVKKKGEEIKDELCEKLIPKIRYFRMTGKQFINGPVNSGLLKDDQWPSLLANMASNECRIPIPDGFIKGDGYYGQLFCYNPLFFRSETPVDLNNSTKPFGQNSSDQPLYPSSLVPIKNTPKNV